MTLSIEKNDQVAWLHQLATMLQGHAAVMPASLRDALAHGEGFVGTMGIPDDQQLRVEIKLATENEGVDDGEAE